MKSGDKCEVDVGAVRPIPGRIAAKWTIKGRVYYDVRAVTGRLFAQVPEDRVQAVIVAADDEMWAA